MNQIAGVIQLWRANSKWLAEFLNSVGFLYE
jgi:hypothetical protein